MNFLGGKRKKSDKRIMILVDWENLLKSMKEMPPAEVFSVTAGFDKFMKTIALEIGEIVNVFIFIPSHMVVPWAETFHRQGFFTIVCPKIRGKTGEEEDTTDATIINFGKTVIENTRNLTHLCIGSGDKDFSLLVRQAIRKGLKIVVVASSERSLSMELIRLADKVYIFSPTDS